MNVTSVIGLGLLIIVYWVGKRGLSKLVIRIGSERGILASRVHYVTHALTLGWFLTSLIAGVLIINLGYGDIRLFFGSIAAILGVGMAFFAQWSILSNVTASLIIFFFSPFRVGDRVRVVDADSSVEGTITDIRLFHILLRASDGVLTTCPNVLTFQKVVQILPGLADDTEAKRVVRAIDGSEG